jgi:acetate kinase
VTDALPAQDIVLCLNAGSSSLKFALFRVTPESEESLAEGVVDHVRSAEAALSDAFGKLDAQALPKPSLVGHRVVHGGQAHLRPAVVDAELIASLKELIPLAPLHLPSGIAGIEAATQRLPNVPQVACFDTAFHANMPEFAARFAIPSHLFQEGVRRYGFHGLSYEYVLSTLGAPPPARVIVAHLGNGASLAAIKDGRSVDTTMGFTPGGGIPMGTRSGDLDPGLVLYLLREKGYSSDKLEELLEKKSGLLGIAGSADMRELVQRQATDPAARLAIELMSYAVRKTIGAYVAVLGGLDVLVFTGGIGEHTPLFRELACQGLEALGVALDSAKNGANEAQIQGAGSACRVLVVKTDEDRMIARHTRAVVRHAGED